MSEQDIILKFLPQISSIIFKKIEEHCSKEGLTLDYKYLKQHINIGREDISTLFEKPKLTFKPKSQKPLGKKKLIFIKPYQQFINLCKKNKLNFFEFNDEFNWKGPATKITSDKLSLFKSISIKQIKGPNFIIVRPTKTSKEVIQYPNVNTECKLEPQSLINNGSDAEGSDAEGSDAEGSDAEGSDAEGSDAEGSDAELQLDTWTHMETNTQYLLDSSTNELYSFETNEKVGEKIDEFTVNLF